MHTENTFDIAIVGSSPLLVLYALHEDAQGRRVCLIEKDRAWGGAWALANAENGLMLGHHETTCHLIEWYKGGYELLTCLGGQSFEPLDPQPVKVYRSGAIAPYLSRPQIVTGALRTAAYLGYNSMRMLWRVAAGNGDGAKRALRGTQFAWQRLRFEMRFRVMNINEFDCIREPAGGYAQWMTALMAQVRNTGIKVLNATALDAKKDQDGQWLLELSGGKSVQMEKLVLGESTILRSIAGVPLEEHTMTSYHHALVSSDSSDTLIRSRYIHCADDPYLHRVSFLADAKSPDGSSRSCWLVQFRTPDMGDGSVQEAMSGLARRYRFLKEEAQIRVERRLTGSFFRSPVHAALNHATKDDFVVLRTIGDLSRNVLYAKHYQSAFFELQSKVAKQ